MRRSDSELDCERVLLQDKGVGWFSYLFPLFSRKARRRSEPLVGFTTSSGFSYVFIVLDYSTTRLRSGDWLHSTALSSDEYEMGGILSAFERHTLVLLQLQTRNNNFATQP